MKDKTKIQIKEEKIIEASWKLLEMIGIEEFSMRKLAKELNIQAPALYWYFPSKQSIFQALVNELSKEILSSLKLEGDWKKQLYIFAIHIRNTMKIFPCSPQLLMKTLPTEYEYIRLINELLKVIESCNLKDNDKFSSILCLLNYVISFELDNYEQEKNRLMAGEQDTFKESIKNLPIEDSDILQRMFRNGMFKELGSDNMFKSGLIILLSGIEQLVLKQQSI